MLPLSSLDSLSLSLFLSSFLFSHFINADNCSKCKTDHGVCNSIDFGPYDLAGCHCNQHYVNSNTGGQCNKRLCDCNVRLLVSSSSSSKIFFSSAYLSLSLSYVLLIRALGLKIIMVFVPVPVVAAFSQKVQVCYSCLAPFVHFTVRFCTLSRCLLFLILFS